MTVDHSKTWIAKDPEKGDIFLISIVNHPCKKKRQNKKQWYLTNFTNYFNLGQKDFSETLSNGYIEMMNSVRETKECSYTINNHRFFPEDMSSGYWQGLLKNTKYIDVNLSQVHIPINKKNLEKELSKLIPRLENWESI